MTHLSQIPRVDIAPSVPLPRIHLHQVLLKVLRVLVRLHDIADSEGVDVYALAVFVSVGEATGEGSGGDFAELFGQTVCVLEMRQGGHTEATGEGGLPLGRCRILLEGGRSCSRCPSRLG
jgi:hypothetical protein